MRGDHGTSPVSDGRKAVQTPGSGQSPQATRARVGFEEPHAIDWRQAIGKALGSKLGTVLPTLEEAVEQITALRAAQPQRAPQLCNESDCLNLAYRNFAYCREHVFGVSR